MSYRVDWSQQAIANVLDIYHYIAFFDNAAARRVSDRLLSAGDSLIEFPRRGREVASGVHDLSVVWPYIIRYSIAGDIVTILRIRHGARQSD